MKRALSWMAGGAVVAGSLFVAGVNVWMLRTFEASSPAEARPADTVVVVFGAPPGSEAYPNPYLYRRLDRGLEAARAGHTIFFTGAANEAEAASRFFAEAGLEVPLDSTARRTVDSVREAVRRYPDRQLLAVSQAFHIPRIRYLCKQAGAECTGWPAEDPGGWRIKVRETLARVRAVLER
ncbi:MAG: ElyC/SanA/YdcF family protein [Bacteroidota bacterium]